MNVSHVHSPPVDSPSAHYQQHRAPLALSPLLKLPLGAVKPNGWLKHQLDLMVEGMTGRLSEISKFLKADNGWFGGEERGWEEQPYWFRGFHDMAVLTGDERCLGEARKWIEAVLSSQRDDGYFGSEFCRLVTGKNDEKRVDLWPHMVMLDAIIHYHEYTGDERVVPFMRRFFAFCRDLSDETFVPRGSEWDASDFGDWKIRIQVLRAGDMLPHLYWLHARTGDAWLLELADRFYDCIQPPENEWLDRHIVHFTQRFAYPGTYYPRARDTRLLEQTEFWYQQHMATWGQQPRGIFGADERVRSGKVDPRQGFETCGMTEFAKSFYRLGQFTGDTLWADRCEDVLLNHFAAAQDPDLKGLHYLTASNLPQLDATDGHDFTNEQRPNNNQLAYSPHRYRCCQHNVAMGWPWYAQHQWMASADGGLVAWMYGASEVTAKVGESGEEVSIRSETDYPFRENVSMTIASERSGRFPLYLRVPRWCSGMQVHVNGQTAEGVGKGNGYVRIEREWREGDRIEIRMPMEISVTRWPRTGSATVDRGPLSYSVRIDEKWTQCGGSDEWPESEVLPTSPWNYGLVLDERNPTSGLEVVEKDANARQPWTLEGAPLEIRAKGRRIPEWRIEDNQTVAPLQQSPIKSTEPEEVVSLVPLGCARQRISCLPVIGDGPGARAWR